MKIKQDTNIGQLASFGGNEPADHLMKRQLSVVDDSYIFQPGENDLSSIVNWYHITVSMPDGDTFVIVAKDLVYRYAEIKTLFVAKGADEDARWAACTDGEKDVVAALYLVSTSKRLERYTAAEDMQNFIILGEDSITSRTNRINAVQLVIGQQLTNQADRADLWRSTQLLTDAYINAGDTGSGSLTAWMNNTGDYATNGFAQKSYYSEGLKDSFNDIVQKGNY